MKYEFRVGLYFPTRYRGNGWTERTKEFNNKEELIDWCTRWDEEVSYKDIDEWVDEQEGKCIITDTSKAQGFKVTETQIY